MTTDASGLRTFSAPTPKRVRSTSPPKVRTEVQRRGDSGVPSRSVPVGPTFSQDRALEWVPETVRSH